MNLFKSRSCRESFLPEHVVKIIREGVFDWIENRKYRSPEDSIESFAESLGVTKDDVTAFLRHYLNLKYSALKRMLRIHDAAVMLLLLPGKPLGHIGNMVGCSDLRKFRRQFREFTHHTPESYRRRVAAKREAPRPTLDEHRPVTPTLTVWLPVWPGQRAL